MQRVPPFAVFTLLAVLAVPRLSTAQTPDEAFRADIERLLDVTGASALGLQLATMATDSMFAGLRQAQPDIPEQALIVIRDVLTTEFGRMFQGPDSVMPRVVDIYVKHFTHDEVRALLDFYTTPVGRKVIRVMPMLAQESSAVGQRWAEANMPHILSLVEKRLRAEGFLK